MLQQVIKPGGVGAELGVYWGDFTAVLLEHTKPAKLHLVDPWYRLGPTWDWGPVDDRSTIDALRSILRRYTSDLVSGRTELHIGSDLEILPAFPDRCFDWVYIDSSHAYEHTRDELRILATKMKSDGVIAGDDWRPDPSHRHHGVYRAVTEFLAGNPGYELAYSDATDLQWAIHRRDSKVSLKR